MRRAAVAASLTLLLASPPAALAGRPMVTDDARVAEENACQVESWIRRTPEATEAWALPACNPGGNLELTFGGARTYTAGESRFTDQVVQAKTLLHALGDDGWGLGLTLGTIRHPARESAPGWPGDAYLNVPLSVAIAADSRWVAHLNAGIANRRDVSRTLATWAFGNEVLIADTTFVPEVFRSDFGRPFFQVGVRHGLGSERLQAHASVGNRIHGGSGERWFSVGLSIYPAAFLH
jgi:hypothetical protein